MLAEWRGLEYVLEILRILQDKNDILDSKQINEIIKLQKRIESSLSYVQKILPRMVKMGLISSTLQGYKLVRPTNEIMIDEVLNLCMMPEGDSAMHNFVFKIKEALSLTSIDEFYS